MLTFLRHLLSILLLPVLAVVVVPYWLVTTFADGYIYWSDGSFIVLLFRSLGVLFLVVGLGLFIWCVSLFAKVGEGTLAPWDPTRNLVAVGPYRFVRNPMISSVAFLLIGQALFRVSWVIGIWAGVFMIINHVYFIFSEEPGLEKRFGESYRIYKENVPRWIPRLRPWADK
ncbi:MAG: isoprenylcysteine carboxylmethyltransferase family protein [Chloroflexi bacterium]|nr:isoprenylcysteine carboxylmethyltransferase family protein [Chloroflexota bacterium]